MAHPISFAHPVEPLATEPLDDVHLGFDAWLLPPRRLDRTERMMHAVSIGAGPIAFACALAAFLIWLV